MERRKRDLGFMAPMQRTSEKMKPAPYELVQVMSSRKCNNLRKCRGHQRRETYSPLPTAGFPLNDGSAQMKDSQEPLLAKRNKRTLGVFSVREDNC